MRLLSNLVPVVFDALTFARNLLRSQSALAAENLFLRKQLTFYVERELTPRRTDNATRVHDGYAHEAVQLERRTRRRQA